MGWGYVGTPVGGSSRAVVNAAANLYTIGHQLGHGLGVWNANALYCGSRSIGTGAECSGREGGDPSDIMGYGYAGHMNAVLKEQLGWLGDNASPPITEITASQTFKLEPYEVKTPNAKALKVLKSTNADGSSDFYYLEYRQPIGFDSSMPWPGFLNGVLIHSGNSKNMNSSYLLDMTPGDGNFTNAALLPGKTFTDTNAVGGGVSITVDSVGPSGANLTFKFGSKARSCMYSAPVLKIEPDSVVWVQQGQDFVYDVDVSSLQTAECQEEEYSFLLAVPSGVSAELSQKSIALREGTHATLKLTVHASSTITDGIYDIVVVGQNTKDLTLVKSVTAKLGIQVAGLN
jgi:hypothetical protein